MISKARLIASCAALGTLLGVDAAPSRIGEHFWPTPNGAFVENRPLSQVLQPTQTGRLESALWGCVRNGGSRFHEGVDLRALYKDASGEATDAIYAFDEGVVRYVNRNPRESSYGRYLVIEHPHWMPGLVTLYAHLSDVPSHIGPGATVAGGQTIATMGRSASYTIPKSRAHLHFEIGLWLGPRFQRWYDRQSFTTPNDHGVYNGLNIIGFDVWAILQTLRSGKARTVMDYLASEPAAVAVTIWDGRIPDLLMTSPELMENGVIPPGHTGWQIDFSLSGAPKRFRAITWPPPADSRKWVAAALDPDRALSQPCASLVLSKATGGASPRLVSILDRLFTP